MRRQRRVLFVLKYRDAPYGWGGEATDRPLSSGLCNSAGFVADMLAAAGVPTRLVHVVDGNGIHREIAAFGATDVVVEAFWCPPYKFDDLRAACPDVRFIVRNHSKTPFLAQEGVGFGWTLDYLDRPNVVVAPNSLPMLADSRALAEAAHPDWHEAELARKLLYLPNFYPVLPAAARKADDGESLDIGCFGAVRPLKNLATQGIGALVFAEAMGRRLRFHVNGGRLEMGGQPVRRSLEAIFAATPRAELVSHDWLAHDAFRALVASMDLVSQVTFSETFSIVAADAASQGVPLATSPEVPWTDPACHADPTDARSIAAAMQRAWSHRRRLVGFDPNAHRRRLFGFDPNAHGLRRYSEASRRIWLEAFAP